MPVVRVQGAVRPAEVEGEEPSRVWAEPNVKDSPAHGYAEADADRKLKNMGS